MLLRLNLSSEKIFIRKGNVVKGPRSEKCTFPILIWILSLCCVHLSLIIFHKYKEKYILVFFSSCIMLSTVFDSSCPQGHLIILFPMIMLCGIFNSLPVNIISTFDPSVKSVGMDTICDVRRPRQQRAGCYYNLSCELLSTLPPERDTQSVYCNQLSMKIPSIANIQSQVTKRWHLTDL